jgi:hypothetical protein
MWITNQLGVATWTDAGTKWEIDARGGQAICVGQADTTAVQLKPVDDGTLPAADEQFVRGRSWNVNYPQAEHRHALRMAFEVIATTSESLLLESTISIQTDLLDSHPKIDIELDGKSVQTLNINDGKDQGTNQTGSAAVTIVRSDTVFAAIFLGPHDSPFTTDLSTPESLKLRLFGEFLEKGVIRKARPWILISRATNEPIESELLDIWQQLANRPLPLAS